MSSESSETSEVWVLDLHNPGAGLACVAARQTGVLYSVDHRGEQLFIVTNADGALDFKLVVADLPLAGGPAAGRDGWAPVPGFEYNPAVKVDSVLCFERFLAVFGRKGGLTAAWALLPPAPGGGAWAAVAWQPPEAAYEVGPGTNEDYGSAALRLAYNSMVTPPTAYDFDPVSGVSVVVKATTVPGYDPSRYRTARLAAVAADGRAVPVSVVWRADSRPDGEVSPGPMLLDGYGSYGLCCEPDWDMKARTDTVVVRTRNFF